MPTWKVCGSALVGGECDSGDVWTEIKQERVKTRPEAHWREDAWKGKEKKWIKQGALPLQIPAIAIWKLEQWSCKNP